METYGLVRNGDRTISEINASNVISLTVRVAEGMFIEFKQQGKEVIATTRFVIDNETQTNEKQP